MSAPPPKKPGGFSLYGDLLNPSSGATISGAPVKYEMKSNDAGQSDAQAAAQKKKDASLKFQPVIKRPQAPASGRGRGGKARGGNTSSSGHKFSSSTVEGSAEVASSPQVGQGPQQQRSKFADWVGDEEEDYYQFDNRPKPPRGGRKGKNKRQYKEEEQEVDWDAIYDPTKPSVALRYKGSTEQDAERREWKNYLYRHASKKNSKMEEKKPKNAMFAPPTGLNAARPSAMGFAPPSFDDPKPVAHDPMDLDDEDEYRRPAFKSDRPSFASPAPVNVPDDPTGEDAYARRMRMSGSQSAQMVTSPPPPVQQWQPPVTISSPVLSTAAAPPAAKAPPGKAEALAKLAAIKAKFEASRAQAAKTPAAASPTPPTPAAEAPPTPAPSDPSTISRAPIRYKTAQPSPPPEPPAKSSRAPGQKDFGARMMEKMGYKKGQGLGATGEGITTALSVQASKRKKRSNQEGGGWAQPAMGRIVGGKRNPAANANDSNGKYGTMSPVVKLSGMLKGLDVQYEIEENNMMQEVGDEFGKYGNIERLFIWREEMGGDGGVFVKYTSPLSALNTINAKDAMIFAGNEVHASFYNEEKFENGEYA